MKTLVTGASGMLGANLCRELIEQGQEVRAFARRVPRHPLLHGLDIEQICGDVCHLPSLQAAMRGCDRIFHTAGIISYHPSQLQEMLQINVAGTANVLRAATQACVRRVVVTSSTAAIGLAAKNGAALDERSPFLRKHERVPYMYAKKMAEEVATRWHGIEVVVVNPATIFGAGDVNLNTGRLFGKIQAGGMLACPPGGTSIVSVRDCVRGHLLAMERGIPGERYILASSQHTYQELFAAIAAALGVKPPRFMLPRALGPLAYGAATLAERTCALFGSRAVTRHLVTLGFAHRYFSSERAQRELGWRVTQSLHDMLAEAVAFYRQNDLL